jgi:hypothetical protein
MIQTGYALPTALALCEGLETGWDRRTCTNGVFMENVNTSFGLRSSWLDDEDPLYPCQAVPVAHRDACYLRTATRILALRGYDFAAAARVCASVRSPWAAQCFRGLGRDAVDASYSATEALARCRPAESLEGDCVYGVARTVLDRYGLEGARGVLALCGRVEPRLRDDCFAAVGGVVGLRHASAAARRRACARLTSEHLVACVEAARAEVDPSGRVAWG